MFRFNYDVFRQWRGFHFMWGNTRSVGDGLSASRVSNCKAGTLKR